MGCLIALLAVSMPRVALFIIWVFTPYVSNAFHGVIIWPLIGLLFLPFTTIAYSLAWKAGVGVTGSAWLWVGLGVVLDVVWHGGSEFGRRREY